MKKTFTSLFLILMIVASAGAYGSTSNKLLEYSFDQGCPVQDHSGNNNDGTCGGSLPVYGTGISKSNGDWDFNDDGSAESYDFYGSGEYVDIGTYSTFSEYAVSFWFNPDDFGGNRQFVFHIRGNNWFYCDNDAGGGTLICKQRDSNGNWNTIGSTSVSNGQWYHVVLNWDGSTSEMFVDDNSVGSTSVSSIGQTGDPNYVGGNAGYNHWFDGEIDEFRIFTRDLTSTEINNLYEINSIEPNQAPTIDGTDYSPDTWGNGTQPDFSFNASDDEQVSEACVDVYEEGSQIVTDQCRTYSSSDVSDKFTDLFTVDESEIDYQIDLTVKDNDGASSSTSTIKTVDFTAPRIDLFHPQGNVTGFDQELNYTVEDANLDTGSCSYSKDGGTQFSISNCQNTTMQFNTVGNHSATVYASDTYGNTGNQSTSFLIDVINTITLESSTSGATIQDFTVTLENDSVKETLNTTSGTASFNTLDAPKGNVSVRLDSDGYVPRTEYFQIDDSFQKDATFSLERAGITLEAFDAQNPDTRLKQINVTVSNSTMTVPMEKERSYSASGTLYGYNSYEVFETVDLGDTSGMIDDEFVFKVQDHDSGSSCGGCDQWFKTEYIYSDGSSDNQSHFTSYDVPDGYENTYYESYDKELEKVRFWGYSNDGSDPDAIEVVSSSIRDSSLVNGRLQDSYSKWVDSGLPTGYVEFRVEGNNYVSRSYFGELASDSRYYLKAYLLKEGEGIYVTTEVRKPDNTVLENALVTVQKQFDNLKTVSQARTKTDGTASFYLNPDRTYSLFVTYPSYESFSGSFSPVNYQYDPLIIRLGEENNYIESTVWDSVEYSLKPDRSSLNATGAYNFTWSVIDSSSSLSDFGLRVFDESGNKLEEKVVSGSPSGGNVTLEYNISNSSVKSGEDLKVTGFFVKDSQEFNYERSYPVIERVSPGVYSISSLMSDFEKGNGSTAQSFAALLFTLMVATGLKSRFNRFGGGVVTLLVLGMFTWRGWLDPFFWTLTALAVIGIYGRGRN